MNNIRPIYPHLKVYSGDPFTEAANAIIRNVTINTPYVESKYNCKNIFPFLLCNLYDFIWFLLSFLADFTFTTKDVESK